MIRWGYDQYGRRVSRMRVVDYRQTRTFVNPDGTPFTPKPTTLTPLYSRDFDMNRHRGVYAPYRPVAAQVGAD